MLRSRLLVLPVLLLGWVAASLSPLSAAQPMLLRDVNPSPNPDLGPGPVLRDFVTVGSRAVFIIQNRGVDTSTAEIWASDGTDGGTERLRGFRDNARVTLLGATDRAAFYQVIEPADGLDVFTSSLWRSDGTRAGTFPLVEPMTALTAIAWNGKLIFRGCQPDTRYCEPWVSDGSVAGTLRLRDITPGLYGSAPSDFTPLNGRVYFLAQGPDGPGLWRTDGTPRGTRRVALLPATTLPRDLVATDSRLFFRSGPVTFPPQPQILWTSDGTAGGTRTVAPFNGARAKGPSVLQFLGAVGGLELFLGSDPALGNEIFRTDGTPQGTFAVSAFPAQATFLNAAFSLGDRLLFVINDRSFWSATGERGSARRISNCGVGCPFVLYTQSKVTVKDGEAFFAGASRESGVEPWVSDGTSAGTHLIADLCKGICSSYPTFGPVIHDQVLFYADGNLWGTDGTLGGTRLLAVGAIGPSGEATGNTVAAAGPRLVFSGYDKSFPPDQLALQLKSTVDSPASERVLAAHLADGASSNPRQFTPLRGGAVFIACSSLGNFWWTGGTPETTVPLVPAEEARLICDDPTARVVVLDGIAYFRALGKDAYWYELWRTDGTPAGTYPITENEPGHDVWAMTVFHGKLLFVTNDASSPDPPLSTFWTTDGTPAGTTELFQLPMSFVSDLSVVGDRILFQGYQVIDDNYGPVIAITDGTPAGTVTLRQLGGSNGFRLQDVVQLNGHIFFLTKDTYDGFLWRTDGTPEGTVTFGPAAYRTARVRDLILFQGRLYFMALNIPFNHGEEDGSPALFRSDGTAAGTALVKAFGKDESYIGPRYPPPNFTELNGALLFTAADAAHGSELWKTDGTAAGTVLVDDIHPGPAGSRLDNFAAAGGRVFFSAEDGEHGVEPWASDGTAGGTGLVADISAGPASSFPRELAAIGNQLFFSADDGIVGREPWVLTLDKALLGRIIP
ncbi:MAG: ELWxxDGT repeat protein [Thermoanaerobaculia bacterium]